MKNTNLTMLLALIILFSACSNSESRGLLKGTVNIGPLCPVESIPLQPECIPTEKTFQAFPVAIYSSDKKTIISRISPSANSSYETELPEGNYVVDLENPHPFGKSLPATVEIRKNETTRLDISIDTGIR